MTDPSWTDAGMLWATAGVGLVTCAATAINLLLFRSQVEPEVIVFTELDEEDSTDLNIVILNVGKGAARDVRFTLSERLPDPPPFPPGTFMSSGPLIDGVPFLAPGGRRVIAWGYYDFLLKSLGAKSIRVTATYRSERKIPWWDAGLLTTESVIEVGSFNGTRIRTPPEVGMAESLMWIAEHYRSRQTRK